MKEQNSLTEFVRDFRKSNLAFETILKLPELKGII
jgi:hypothetical protein